jgi:2-polyprenyl-6-methoxyphenol hydroxylase-like FAD-dependent oxidoreductase
VPGEQGSGRHDPVQPQCLGSSRVKAAITAGPAQSGFRQATRRRRTATSCRSTKISTSLEASPRATDDLWLDSVSQVRMDRWANGRIALVGDAASCVSLFGDGSTLAMAGAYTLAEEVTAARTDPRPAFARYEARHHMLVDPRQGAIAIAAALMVPATRTGIAARNLASRLWPAMAAAGWVRNRITPRREPSQVTADV